jgi:NADH dehydrogenase (ubiquinone) Fe-S protein 5
MLTSFAGPSRCFVFWQEVMACYVINTSGDDNKGAEKCIIPLSDYLECLHHRKEVGKAICSCTLTGLAETIFAGRKGSADSGSISEMGGGKCGLRSEECKGCEVVGCHCSNDGGEESPCAQMVTARQAELISE